jgi:hypothetical protein
VVPAKTWLAIPALAIACAGLAFLARTPVEVAIAIGAVGAALAAAVRAFAGPSLAVAVAAGAASLVGALALVAMRADLRDAIACAAGMFAVAELARPLLPDASPWPALGAAACAAILDPSFVVLVPAAGVRLATGPWSLPRWTFAAPAIGLLAVVLAILAALIGDGVLADLWTTWAGRSRQVGDPIAVVLALGDELGPVTSVVAIAGLAACAVRGALAASCTVGVAIAAIGVDLVAGGPGPATLVIAALGAGAGIARFAALVRWPTGQAFVGATVGVMLVVVPVWSLTLR